MADNLESLENQLEIFIENIRQVSKVKVLNSDLNLTHKMQYLFFRRSELSSATSSSKDSSTRRFKASSAI